MLGILVKAEAEWMQGDSGCKIIVTDDFGAEEMAKLGAFCCCEIRGMAVLEGFVKRSQRFM